MQAVRNDEVSKTYNADSDTKQSISSEVFRLISLAQTEYENAAMWAVKAVTHTPEFEYTGL